jgi:hypothetical protein
MDVRFEIPLGLAKQTEPTKAPTEGQNFASSIEMDWKAFAGHEEDAYRAILLARMTQDFGSFTAVRSQRCRSMEQAISLR